MSERIPMGGLRRLDDAGAEPPARAAVPERDEAARALAARAEQTLRAEFAKAMALKQKLADEAAASGPEKSRPPSSHADALRSLVASLEGMSRFAIAMGILTPAENKAIWSEHVAAGLYEGWR